MVCIIIFFCFVNRTYFYSVYLESDVCIQIPNQNDDDVVFFLNLLFFHVKFRFKNKPSKTFYDERINN